MIISAGNVMGFLAPSTRVEVLRRFGTHLAEDGRVIVGFGGGRGYEFADFFADLDLRPPDLLLGVRTLLPGAPRRCRDRPSCEAPWRLPGPRSSCAGTRSAARLLPRT